MATVNGVKFQHKSSTTKGVHKMVGAQKKSSRQVRATASGESGGHGTRTRNRFPGTTFPVWPLAIRLPSESASQSIVPRRFCSFNAARATDLRFERGQAKRVRLDWRRGPCRVTWRYV
jgi:hypothetical protein